MRDRGNCSTYLSPRGDLAAGLAPRDASEYRGTTIVANRSAQRHPFGRHTLRDQRSELPERRLDERLFLTVANLGTHAALFAPLLSPTLSRSLRAQSNLRILK